MVANSAVKPRQSRAFVLYAPLGCQFRYTGVLQCEEPACVTGKSGASGRKRKVYPGFVAKHLRTAVVWITFFLGALPLVSARAQDGVPPSSPAPLWPALAVAKHHMDIVSEHPTGFSVQIQLDVDVFAPRTLVPLVPTGVALESVTVNGSPASLVEHGDLIAAVVEEPGNYKYRAQVFVSGSPQSSGASLVSIPMLSRPTTTVRAQLAPALHKNLQISPASWQRAQQTPTPALYAIVPPTRELHLGVQAQASNRAPVPFRAQSDHHLHLGNGEVRGVVSLKIDAGVSMLDRAVVRIPAGVIDLRAQGATLETPVEPGELALLQFSTRASQQRVSLRYRLAGETLQKPLDLPVFSFPDAQSTQGDVVVSAESGLKVQLSEPPQGYTTGKLAAARDKPLGTNAGEPQLVLAQTHASAAAKIKVYSYEHEPLVEGVVRRLRAHTLLTGQGKAITDLVLELRAPLRPFVKIGLGKGAHIWSATACGAVVQPVRDKDGQVLIDLARGALTEDRGDEEPTCVVELTWIESAPSLRDAYGTVALSLPTLDRVAADVVWVVRAPEHYTADRFAGSATKAEMMSEGAVPAMVLEHSPEGVVPLLARAGLWSSRLGLQESLGTLLFHRSVLTSGEQVRVSWRYFDRRYVGFAEWLALLGLFLGLVSIHAHVLHNIGKGALAFRPIWVVAGSLGLGTFVAFQSLLPVSWPSVWLLAAIVVLSGFFYGTVVFWTAIISLVRRLWSWCTDFLERRAEAQEKEDTLFSGFGDG